MDIGFTAIIVAFLARLNPLAVIVAGLVIALAELGGDTAQISMGIPKVVTGIFKGILLFMLLAGETLTRYRLVRVSGIAGQGAAKISKGGRQMFDELLLTVLLTSIPLILAATGELVVERSGVLNLGVEGMMLMGAVAAFGAASLSGSPYIGIQRRAGWYIRSGYLFVICFGSGHQSGGDRAGANHFWYRSFWPYRCAAGRTGNRRITYLAFAFYFKTAHFLGHSSS